MLSMMDSITERVGDDDEAFAGELGAGGGQISVIRRLNFGVSLNYSFQMNGIR